MIQATIAEMASIWHVEDIAYDTECTSLTLHLGSKGRVVVTGGGSHIHRPSGVDRSGIQIERKNQVFLGRATVRGGHGVQKHCARAQVDNRRPSDPHRVDVAAGKIHQRNRSAYISLPDGAAIYSVQRVNVVRFCRSYDRRPPARTVIDV